MDRPRWLTWWPLAWPPSDGLVERWLVAVETDMEHRVEADATAAIGPLTELTARYPAREGLWALR